MAFIKVFILVLVCTFVDARSSGAQTPTACQDMTPRHNSAAAQSTPAPYSIVLSNNTYYGGERIRVTIENTTASPFKGYFIQARNSNGALIAGFDISGQSNSQFRTCSSTNDAVTHTEATDKSMVSFEFNAPRTSQGNITIYATVVQSFNTFWVMIPSELITDMAPDGTNAAAVPSITVLAVMLPIICMFICFQ